MLKVYTYNIRLVLEYAAQVWQDIPAYLFDAIESLQRRALRIIFPNSSYQQAVDQANLTSLADRRIFICKKLMADMKNESHPISFLAARSNKLLKQFAPELAPLIQDIYNESLRERFVPDTLKVSIISPVPKVCPLKTLNRT